MDLAQIKAFIDAMASSDLAELEATKDGWTLRLVRNAGPVPAKVLAKVLAKSRDSDALPAAEFRPDEVATAEPAVCAPLSGIVYLRPSPDQPPFVVPGQVIKAGATVCVVEAMKMFNEVRAEQDGVVSAILVESETLVDAGQPLIRLA